RRCLQIRSCGWTCLKHSDTIASVAAPSFDIPHRATGRYIARFRGQRDSAPVSTGLTSLAGKGCAYAVSATHVDDAIHGDIDIAVAFNVDGAACGTIRGAMRVEQARIREHVDLKIYTYRGVRCRSRRERTGGATICFRGQC